MTLSKKLCAFLSLVPALGAHAAIAVGDVAVVGMSGDTKDLSFVAVNDLAAGEIINFTDSGWLGSSFRANEGGAIYTVPAGGISAGTVISASGTSDATWAANGAEWTAPPTGVGTNGMNFSTGGDQVLVFQGDGSSPTFIFALNGASTIFSAPANADDSNRTALPTGLTVGDNAVAAGAGAGDESEFDNVYYTGPTTFNSSADLLSAVADSGNWTGSNTDYVPPTSFTIIPEPATSLLGGLALLFFLRRGRR